MKIFKTCILQYIILKPKIMLHRILNLDGVQELDKKKLLTIQGGGWPTNEEDCLACGGEWGAPLCALPSNSVCL